MADGIYCTGLMLQRDTHKNRILKVIHAGAFLFYFLMYVGFGVGINGYNPLLMILIVFSWLCLIINYSVEKFEFGFQWLQGWKQNYNSNCKVLTCFIAFLSTRTVLTRLKSQPVFHWKCSWRSCVVFPTMEMLRACSQKSSDAYVPYLSLLYLKFLYIFSFVLKLLHSHV